jgi:hypothetical protein
MRLFRWALVAVLCVVLGVAIYQTFLWLGVWGNLNESQVKDLQDGDQEIALIEPATSTDDWGRIVTALEQLEKDWPRINPTLPPLTVSMQHSFPPLTVDVPEIAFSLGSAPGPKLRLRWYKISGEHDAASWVGKLHARGREPLAIIGGGTSDRAIKLAFVLRNTYGTSDPRSPVFLITTATAEETNKSKQSVIGIYKDRSFRFSFTNRKMVDSLLAFIQNRQFPDEAKQWGADNLWAHEPADPNAFANVVIGLPRGLPALQPYAMYAVAWQDERYSRDMFELFKKEFKEHFPLGEFDDAGSIPGSIGGFYQPAPAEQFVVGTFLARQTPVTPNSFLVLPTQTVRMRRFLMNLQRRSPAVARNLVILNGDAIALDAIFRDRDVAWNILDVPYSLVFFAHRNPVDRTAGFPPIEDGRPVWGEGAGQRTTTGTHDILLYRDVFEAFLYAAFADGKLLDDPALVRDRLRATCWHQPPAEKAANGSPRVCNPQVQTLDGPQRRFFDAAGDRQSHTGEHIVWLKPFFTDQGVDLKSKISVWTIQPDDAWQFVEAFDAFYNQSRLEGPQP